MFSNVDLTDKKTVKLKGNTCISLSGSWVFYIQVHIIFTDLKKIKCPNKKMSSFFYSFFNNVPC